MARPNVYIRRTSEDGLKMRAPACAGSMRVERRILTMNFVQQIEQAEIATLTAKRELPEFNAGDTVRVHVRVTEGTRTRLQAYEGVVIGRKGGGLNQSFTVRKISYGEGVERVFPVYSPMVEKVEVVRRGKVRR